MLAGGLAYNKFMYVSTRCKVIISCCNRKVGLNRDETYVLKCLML